MRLLWIAIEPIDNLVRVILHNTKIVSSRIIFL
jgi:hypothetical protein